MKLLITGASGFLGQYVVAEALRRGHEVRAVVRSPETLSLPWHEHPAVQFAKADLRQKNSLIEAVQGVDAVVHLAAAMRGNFQTQYDGTVTTTGNLLSAMQAAQVSRLVAISSFSVFDYLSIPAGSVIQEESPLEQKHISQRGAYAQTKRMQETMVQEFGLAHAGQVTILRPGMIYGRDHLWNAHAGLKAGSFWVQIGANGQMPLIYVENCAEAIVLAAERSEAIGQTLNLIDDSLPTQTEFVSALTQRMKNSPKVIPFNWVWLRLIAQPLSQINALFKGKLKLPGLFVPASLDARFKPFRYSNDRAKQVLNWQPRYSFEAAIDRSCSNMDVLKTAQPS